MVYPRCGTGNKDAIETRDLLEKKMNAPQISEAQKLVEEIRLKGTMKVKACTKCNRLKPESSFCRIAVTFPLYCTTMN
jgi:hypothetical protein